MKMTRITGPRTAEPLGPLDPRDHAWREDLADIALAGLVAVPNYVKPVEMIALHQVPLLTADRADAPASSELLPGEHFAVLDTGHGYAWGYGTHDRYVGHVRLDALGPVAGTDGQPGMIGPGDALLFAQPALKAEVVATLPMASRIAWNSHDERFVQIAGGAQAGRFLHRRHLLPPSGTPDADWVQLAERFIGAPYRWGGRTRTGADCSGVIQIARMLAGHACRRDTDMQAADFPVEVDPADARRGDLAWWPGHIGVMVDESQLLHANAHWMTCCVEPLADVIARAAANGGPAQPRMLRP